MSQARTVTATFTADPPPPGSYTLSVNRTGSGSGTVSSSPSGVNCGSTCNANYTDGTVVTLTASADSGSSFTGWSSNCAVVNGECQVTMTEARTVTATFSLNPTPPADHPLSVTRTGSGRGTITSQPGGIECLPNCVSQTSLFQAGTTVTLTAVAAPNSRFTGWSGEGCSGTGTCEVTMSQSRSVTAAFSENPAPPGTLNLTVSKSGSGSGTVTSSPAGINCGGTCLGTFAQDSRVTLTAKPQSGSTFTGWGDACAGVGTEPPSAAPWTCTVTMDAAKTVTATFAPEAEDRGRISLDIQVTKQVLDPGESTIQTIVVRNTGKGEMNNLMVWCEVCKQMILVDATRAVRTGRDWLGLRTLGRPRADRNKIKWNVGTLRPGKGRKMRVRVRALRGAKRKVECPVTARARSVKPAKKKVWFRFKRDNPPDVPVVTG